MTMLSSTAANLIQMRRFAKATMVKAKKFIYQTPFKGLPKETDFKLVEEEIPPLKDGEFLAEAVYLSVDPYMRAYSYRQPLGSAYAIGSQVAKVIDSKNPKFKVGQHVAAEFGWSSHTISDGKRPTEGFIAPWVLPDSKDVPLSYFLGILGMPGNTAYFGFLEICQPKAGETVVISGAAGAVGNIVGQIAKIKGCTVVGIAGSDEKGKWLVDELNFDHFVNYKDQDFEKKLNELTPKGIDCYFDNVGGEISSIILRRMNLFGRIAVCGAISGYNDSSIPKATIVQYPMVFSQLKMEGFLVTRWADRWLEGINQNKEWIKEGKLKCRETVTDGFENMFKAFVDMLNGKNFGKAVVKA